MKKNLANGILCAATIVLAAVNAKAQSAYLKAPGGGSLGSSTTGSVEVNASLYVGADIVGKRTANALGIFANNNTSDGSGIILSSNTHIGGNAGNVAIISGIGDGTQNGNIRFATVTNNTPGAGYTRDNMTVNGSTGYVGIGTTSPVAGLHVVNSAFIDNGQLSIYGSTNGLAFSGVQRAGGQTNQQYFASANADKFYFSPSGAGANAVLALYRWNGTSTVTPVIFDAVGNAKLVPYGGSVVIGANALPSTAACNKLYVNGTIGAKEVRVSTNNWCDYVFDATYQLKPLAEVESYIQTNSHLPEVPSEKEVVQNGVAVGDMLKIHMQKIEELTLYVIQQNKRIQELEKFASDK